MNVARSAAPAMAGSANDIGLPRKGYRNGGSQRRFDAIEARGSRFRMPDTHPALAEGRSLFQARVYPADAVPRLLVSGVNSRKIGRVVAKGQWRGAPIFTLTLEERRTCPRSCTEWRSCYGNSMNWARRITVGPEFERRLWAELEDKHVLGDFYSVDYAQLWADALAEFPALRIFGFTAHPPTSPIGEVLCELMGEHRGRAALRFSGFDAPTDGSVVIERGTATDHIICPAQTGGADCCATCALCWHSDRTIAFWRH